MRITARNFELTETLREYIGKRLGHLDRYSDHIIDSEIILIEERGQYKGEMIVKVKGRTIKAETKDNDVLKVVDELKDIVIRELKKYEEKLKDHRKQLRIFFIFSIVVIFYFIFLLRLFELQILRGEEFRRKSYNNHFYTIKVKPSRGNIYDRNGFIIAGNSTSTKNFIITKEKDILKEYENYIASLNGYYSDIMDYFESSSVISRRDLLSDVVFVPITSRVYPYGDLTPHFVGYVNSDGIGVEGFEKIFDDSLKGQEGEIIIPVDARMNITDRNKIIYNFPKKGKDYKLTIDIKLHKFIDSLLEKYEREGNKEKVDEVLKEIGELKN